MEPKLGRYLECIGTLCSMYLGKTVSPQILPSFQDSWCHCVLTAHYLHRTKVSGGGNGEEQNIILSVHDSVQN